VPLSLFSDSAGIHVLHVPQDLPQPSISARTRPPLPRDVLVAARPGRNGSKHSHTPERHSVRSLPIVMQPCVLHSSSFPLLIFSYAHDWPLLSGYLDMTSSNPRVANSPHADFPLDRYPREVHLCVHVHVPDWGRIVLGGHEDPSLGHPGAGAAGHGGTVQPGERVMMPCVCVCGVTRRSTKFATLYCAHTHDHRGFSMW